MRPPPEELARAETSHGTWVLRRRCEGGEAAYEIIANGAFLMDTREHTTERALATLGLEGMVGASVLVGGLGFGYTLRAVLEHPATHAVDLVELEPTLVEWVGGPLRGLHGDALSDPRVEVHVADVHDHLAVSEGRYDAILLDVDNGPEFLVHEDNARLYAEAGLTRIHRALRPGGRVVVWSSERSPGCLARLEATFPTAYEHPVPIAREGHRFTYYLYAAER